MFKLFRPNSLQSRRLKLKLNFLLDRPDCIWMFARVLQTDIPAYFVTEPHTYTSLKNGWWWSCRLGHRQRLRHVQSRFRRGRRASRCISVYRRPTPPSGNSTASVYYSSLMFSILSVVCNVCIVAKRCVLARNCPKKQIANGLWGIDWSHYRWRHVIPKGEGRDPNRLRAQYLENCWRWHLTTIAVLWDMRLSRLS